MRKECPNLLLLDSGDSFSAKKDYPRIRAEAVWAGMDLMGYDALNLSDGELSFGIDVLKEMMKGRRFPLVSANVSIPGEASIPIRPYIIKRIGDIDVGVTGILPGIFVAESVRSDPRLSIADDKTALKEIVSELRGKTDLIVLLSHLGYDGTVKFFEDHPMPEIAVAIAGHGRNLSPDVKAVNGTRIVQVSIGGEFMGKMILRVDKGKVTDCTASSIALTDDYADHPEAKRIMDQFKENRIQAQQRDYDARKKEKNKEEVTQYLHLKPEEFLQMMKKQQQEDDSGLKPQKVPPLPAE